MTEASVSSATPAPSAPPLADRVREFFTLQAAEREVKALPEGPRTAAQRALAIAYQKRDAAETLWPRGSCAEALKLARAAVDGALGALDGFADATGPAAWIDEARGLAAAARDKAEGRPLPEIESEATPEDEGRFRALVEAVLGVQRVVGPHLAGEADLRDTRRARIGGAVVAALAAVLAIAWILHTPDFRSASASAQTPEDGADKAIDGDTKTMWYPPGNQLGYLDLALWKPRRVKALRVMAINPPWHDRGIKDGAVRCYLGNDVVKEADVTFAAPLARGTPTGAWTDVTLDAPKCDRIRVEAKSFYGVGVGVAEVELK